jgi:hypothetical protein
MGEGTGVRLLGLEPLLSALRESGLPVGVAEVSRLREVFALEPGSTNPRLRSVLRAVLVKSAEDRDLFERIFDAWIARSDQDLSLREAPVREWAAAQVEKAPRPRLRRYFWRTAAAVVLGLLSFALGDPVRITKVQPKKIIADPVYAQTGPRSPITPQPAALTPDAIRGHRFVTWVPILTVTPGQSVWQGWPSLVLGVLALATAGGLWLALSKRNRFPPPAPNKKGPPRVFLAPPQLAGPQLLEAREEEALVWGIGHFVAEEPTRRLDLPATVRATASAAGIPHLRFQQARYPREVWLWVDEAADDPAILRIATEVESALQAHSLPVERALFRGVPDWLVSAAGQTFAPNEVDERRDAALVAILTDGRILARHSAADDRRVRLDALLRSLSHWPRLAFVDFSTGPSELASLLPKHSLARITPMELAAFLGSDEALRRRAVTAADGEALWAAACALAPSSVDEQRAFDLRFRLGLAASPWSLRALRIEAPGPPGRLQWRAPDRARRVNWLRAAEDQAEDGPDSGSLLGQALAFWETVYDQELKDRTAGEPEASWEGTPAHQHLMMERALLGLWRRRDVPAAVRELYRLHGGALREPVERHLDDLAPLDWGGQEHVHLPWTWEKGCPAAERVMLQKMGFGGGMPTATLQLPGRLWIGLGLCLGLAAGALEMASLSGAQPPEGPPVVVHGPGKPPDVLEGVKQVSAQEWVVSVVTKKNLAGMKVGTGVQVAVRWEMQKLPCVFKLASGAEIWSCGSVEKPPGLNESIGRRLIALATSPGNPEAEALAVDLLDTGSADVVIIGLDWRSYRAGISGLASQEFLVLPDSKWAELAQALRFEGTRTVAQVWPNLHLFAGDPELLLSGCRTGETIEEDGMVFVHICPGTFTMGSADDPPAHKVSLSEYWIGKYEATDRQARHETGDQGSLPAAELSWREAQDFCQLHGWRLPTEAEWENAARAGTQTAWSFGDDEKALGDYAWFDGNSGGELHPVGIKKPNSWGLYDMHGNAWEWVADWYGPYEAKPQMDPTGPVTGDFRVLRGGSFFDSAGNLRSANRFRVGPEDRGSDVGFRCARGPSSPGPFSHRPPTVREKGGG